ncbi:MAG: ZIP family metal transporter [Pyrinomonadaceae bacterium]|nr:ZIP family metal transporter [Blastocatellia bacterium]MCW5958114.1 ZIP family metal transporter [Pyrinomonadaceae bacterium]
MGSTLFQLLLFGVLAGMANILGGMILFPSKIRDEYRGLLRYLLALGAGFMLSVTFFEVIPKTIILWQKTQSTDENLYVPMLLLLGGYLMTQFFEHTIAPHFHLGEEVTSEHVISSKSAYTGVGGLLIHTFLDGVSIAAAAQLDLRIGFLVFIAVFLHKFPEGFTIGSMVLAAGKGRREVLIATSLIGATTLLGVIGFYLIGANIGFSVAYALPLACGVTLYVAASDLIPEINHHGGKSPLVSLSVFAGVAFFFAVHFAVHELAPH